MKPYEDPNCQCHEIQNAICKEYPNGDWNCDKACAKWQIQSYKLKDNKIEFEDYSDENYGCTCPTCGRLICGWCV